MQVCSETGMQGVAVGCVAELPGNGHDVLADGTAQVWVRSFCLKDLFHLSVAPRKVVDLVLQLKHLSLEGVLVLVEVRRAHSAQGMVQRAAQLVRRRRRRRPSASPS